MSEPEFVLTINKQHIEELLEEMNDGHC